MNAGARRILATCVGFSLLALTGCTSSPAADVAPPAALTPSDVGLAAVQAFAALPPAEQQAELQAVTERVDRQLMTMSGLEEELGGAAKADAAYAALSAIARKFAQSLVDQPDAGRFGGYVASEDAPTMGGMMFGNFMTGAILQDAAVNAAKDVAPGTKTGPQSEDMASPPAGAKGAITVEGDVAKSALGVGGEFTVDGITGKLKTVITVAPCPDPKGQFTSTTTMTASVTSAGGSAGTNLTIEMSIKGQVDDDAQLVSYDVDTRTQSAKFENSKGQFVDQTVGWTVGGEHFSNFRGRVNRTGGNVAPGFAEDQAKWSSFTAAMLQDKAVEAAKKGWQSGRCVTLEPTTSPGKRTGLKPSAPVTIVAPPRSKIDGAAVGGTVMGTLNGDSSLSPAGSKVKADATFAYVAPGEKDKTATVSLEARSKRGVAKAEIAFDTKVGGYDLSGSVATAPGGTKVSGQTCDVTEPFTAEASGDMNGTIHFTPTSDVAGTLRFKGVLGSAPFKLTAKGTYTVNVPPDADAGTLDWTWSVTTYTPMGNPTGGGPVSISMTPATGC